jgi:bacteriocin-like protein
MNRHEGIRELSIKELNAVSGGEVKVVSIIGITEPQSMKELYQGWADLGKILTTIKPGGLFRPL